VGRGLADGQAGLLGVDSGSGRAGRVIDGQSDLSSEGQSEASQQGRQGRPRTWIVTVASMVRCGSASGLLGISWAAIAQVAPDELAGQLAELHRWEHEVDPGGAQLPRAKRHDDKTVVCWRPA
jgi:hypothetical protein